MARSRGRRTKRSTPNVPTARGIPDTPQDTTQTVSPPLPPRQVLFHLRLTRNLTRAWRGSSGIFAGIVFVLAFRPTLTIEPSVNLDPSSPLGMQFKITNSGKLPVSDVTFGCRVDAPPK